MTFLPSPLLRNSFLLDVDLGSDGLDNDLAELPLVDLGPRMLRCGVETSISQFLKRSGILTTLAGLSAFPITFFITAL